MLSPACWIELQPSLDGGWDVTQVAVWWFRAMGGSITETDPLSHSVPRDLYRMRFAATELRGINDRSLKDRSVYFEFDGVSLQTL